MASTGDVLVFLDPNCRPTVTTDREGYLKTVAHCARRADVIKVSDEDLAFLAPGGGGRGDDAFTAASRRGRSHHPRRGSGSRS